VITRDVATLRKVPLFAGLTWREAAEIARIGYDRVFPPGEELTQEGERCDSFHVLLGGSVDVVRGGEKVNTLGSGDFFGEVALLGHSARNATITASTDVHALVIPGRDFRAVLGRMPEVHEKVLGALVERL
jgi:CRP-like cAMP-binding protein